MENQINNQNVPQAQINHKPKISSSLTQCERWSKGLLGTTKIPLVVFLIIMYCAFLCVISLFFIQYGFLAFITIANLLFAIFVWGRYAAKIEKKTSTIRYGILFLINISIISLISLDIFFAVASTYSFILFETLLLAASNLNKQMKFFCFRLTGTQVIVGSLIFHFIINCYHAFSIIITLIYALIYEKCLKYKIVISDETVRRVENWCFISCMKEKCSTFISLDNIEIKKDNKDSLLESSSNVQSGANNSFIPENIYPKQEHIIELQQQSVAQGIKTVQSEEKNDPK